MTSKRRRYGRPGELSYDGAHAQVRRQCGVATDYECVDCGGPATDWSYDNADERELTDRATGCTYSADVGRYQPRCRSCHRRWDWAHRRRDRPPLDPEQARMHYRDGWGLRQVGHIVGGYTSADVRRVLVELGEPIRVGRRHRRKPC